MLNGRFFAGRKKTHMQGETKAQEGQADMDPVDLLADRGVPREKIGFTPNWLDAPSPVLDAPAQVLKAINVHVVGTPGKSPEDEVIVLKNPAGEPRALVCAVPYLRDRDIRKVVPGETVEDKARALREGIMQHYADVCATAEQLRQQLGGVAEEAVERLKGLRQRVLQRQRLHVQPRQRGRTRRAVGRAASLAGRAVRRPPRDGAGPDRGHATHRRHRQ